MDNISCLYCCRTFSAKKNLYRHVRAFHPSETVGICNARNICCFCNIAFTTISNLHSHIESNHKSVKLSFEEFAFYSENDFKEWKTKIENDSGARFVKKRGSVEATDGKSKNYFYCHRSGIFENSQQRLKRSRTQKIGKTCPACITTSKLEHDGLCEINVKYQSIHVGHDMLSGKFPLSVNDKSVLAAQMSHNISVSNVFKNNSFSFGEIINENSCYKESGIFRRMLQKESTKSNIEQDRTETISVLKSLLLKCQSSNITVKELKIIKKGVQEISLKLRSNEQNHLIPGILVKYE